MKFFILTWGLLFGMFTAYASLDCKNSEVLDNSYLDKIKKMGKIPSESFSKDEILGKWFMQTKEARKTALATYEFLSDGTVKISTGIADFEIRLNRILIKQRSTNDKEMDEELGVNLCRAAFKVGDSLYVPSREMGMAPLYR